MAKSALNAYSIKYSFPSKVLTSFPSATSVPTPAGVNIAGIPYPAAIQRVASVPCGISSTSSSPDNNCLSNSAFSPTYEAIIFFTCFFFSIKPIPKSSTPALLDMQVSCFNPFFTRASIQFSGIPQRPKPPSIIV